MLIESQTASISFLKDSTITYTILQTATLLECEMMKTSSQPERNRPEDQDLEA